MWSALLRWIPPLQRAEAATHPGPAPGVCAFTGIAGLDTARGLTVVSGNGKLYRTIVARFAQSQADIPAQVHEALANGDVAAAERLAHTLKSVAANIGAGEVQRLAARLEEALRSYEPPMVVQERLRELEPPLAKLVVAIGERLREAAVEPA